jgi:hypothetical protein
MATVAFEFDGRSVTPELYGRLISVRRLLAYIWLQLGRGLPVKTWDRLRAALTRLRLSAADRLFCRRWLDTAEEYAKQNEYMVAAYQVEQVERRLWQLLRAEQIEKLSEVA